MAIYWVSPTGNDNRTSLQAQSESTPWRNISKLNAILGPGDTGMIKPGTYTGTSNNIAPVNSGTGDLPEQRITYQAESPGANISDPDASHVSGGTINLDGKSYITVNGLNVSSVGSMWYTETSTSVGNWLLNCGFTSSGTAAFAASGFRARGNYFRLHYCRIGRWLGTNTIDSLGTHHWIKGCDCNFADSGHGVAMMQNDYAIFEENYVRNKWARFGIFNNPGADSSLGPLYQICQNNIFFDCNPIPNWASNGNEGYPPFGWALEDDGPGDQQMAKTGGQGLIFRNNLIVAMNSGDFNFQPYDPSTNPGGSPYMAVFQIANFNQTVYYTKGRYYHNTFVDNVMNGVSVTKDSINTSFNYDDNRYLNNVMDNFIAPPGSGGVDALAFRMAIVEPSLDTFRWHNNIMTNGLRRASTTYTVPGFEAAFPSQASGNQTGAPTYVNGDYSAALANREDPAQKLRRDNFLLSSGSNGEGDAAPLATVATTRSDGTIVLGTGEALFFTDGNGLIPGDELLIGGNTTRVTGITRSGNFNTITTSPAIAVTAGQPVYMTMFGGTAPDIGIATLEGEEGEGPKLTISTPNVLTTVTATSAANTITSGSFTYTTGSLLIVALAANNGSGVTSIHAVSLSSLSGVTWTKYEEEAGGTNRSSIVVWMGYVTAGGTGATVTATAAGGNMGNRVLSVIELATGVDDTTQVVQVKNEDKGATGAFTVTLAATPDAANMVMAFMASRGTGVAVTEDSDYTGLIEQVAGTNGWLHIQYNNESADTTIAYAGTFGGSANVLLVFEIAASPTGGLPSTIDANMADTLDLAEQSASVVPGGVTVPATTSDLLDLTQPSASVVSVTTIQANPAALTLTRPSVTLIKGATTVTALLARTLNLTEQAATITAGSTQINVSSAIISTASASAAVQPGPVSMPATVHQIAIGSQGSEVTGVFTLSLNPLAFTLTGIDPIIVPGPMTIQALWDELDISGVTAGLVPGPKSIAMGFATLNLVEQPVEIEDFIPGLTVDALPVDLSVYSFGATLAPGPMIISAGLDTLELSEVMSVVDAVNVRVSATYRNINLTELPITIAGFTPPRIINAQARTLVIQGVTPNFNMGPVILQARFLMLLLSEQDTEAFSGFKNADWTVGHGRPIIWINNRRPR
jgi:hypothetical protein